MPFPLMIPSMLVGSSCYTKDRRQTPKIDRIAPVDTAPKPRILVVEDDLKLANLVKEYLENHGYDVAIEGRGDRAVERILGERPDVVVLDLMLPGQDGFSICRAIREEFPNPILMLTARGDEIDEVMGLELGADDYVVKPVRPRILLARIQNLLRRVPQSVAEEATEAHPNRVRIGELEVDTTSRRVFVDQVEVEFTTAEFDLLWLLASHAGSVLSREVIYRELRGIEWDGMDRSVDLRVARVRKKLGDDAKHPRLIKSVRGAGYLMVVDS